MSLFGKKKEKSESCCCSGNYNAEAMEQAEKVRSEGENIKVLGGGCAKCHELEANTKAALEELGMDTEVELVTDFSRIAAYGVMTTPALVIDGKVVSYGKVLKKEEVINILKNRKGQM